MKLSSFYFTSPVLFVLRYTSLASPVRDGGNIQPAKAGERFLDPPAREAAAISTTSQPLYFPHFVSAMVPAAIAKRQTVLDTLEFTLDVPVQVTNDVANGPGFSGTLTTSANALESIVGSATFVLENLGDTTYLTAIAISNGAGTGILSFVFDEPVLWSAPQIYTTTFSGSAEILGTLLADSKCKRDVINGIPVRVSIRFVEVNLLLSFIVIDIID